MGRRGLRYFFHIAYNGSSYHGWQRQPKVLSVQETLEDAFQRLLKHPVNCIGCGRTDAAVHASQYFFHVDLPRALPPDFHFVLNKVLPTDVAVFDILPVSGEQHAQFAASSRSYDYFVHTCKDPFLAEFSTFHSPCDWDLDNMRSAIALLPACRDFRGFCKTPDRHPRTTCDLRVARFAIDPAGRHLQFHFEAKGFLRGMIRLLVGNLLAIGSGQEQLAIFQQHLQAGTSPEAHRMAYPQGLYLSKVTYPFLDLETSGSMPADLFPAEP